MHSAIFIVKVESTPDIAPCMFTAISGGLSTVAVKCNTAAYNDFSSQVLWAPSEGSSAIWESDHIETVSVRAV